MFICGYSNTISSLFIHKLMNMPPFDSNIITSNNHANCQYAFKFEIGEVNRIKRKK